MLIFGEITPKRLATLHNEKMALMYAPLILGLTRLLTPLIFIVNKKSSRITSITSFAATLGSKKIISYSKNIARTLCERAHQAEKLRG